MMQLVELNSNNKAAFEKVVDFREISELDPNRPHSKTFHEYKNTHKFFGFIEVKIDNCHPFLMYSNNDDLVAMTYFWYGPNSYERRSMQEWVTRVKGKKIIFDIGSFSGVYSLAAACAKDKSKDSRIFAFEPTRRVYARLLMNIQANQLIQKVRLIEYAISNSIGLVNFYQYRGNNVLGAGASFVDKGIPSTSSNEIVQAITLDTFAHNNQLFPDLVKIDVEQAEILVLEGMKMILSRSKPDILIEVTAHTAEMVSRILYDFGYKLYVINEGQSDLLPFNKSLCRKVVNLLAEYP